MKKYLLSLVMIVASNVVNAQLETDANGNVSIGDGNPSANTVLAIQKSVSSTSSTENYGVSIDYGTSQNSAMGIRSFVVGNSGANSYSTGIYGFAQHGQHNTGVSGSVFDENGTGIFGSNDGTIVLGLTGKYAGYFSGPVTVTGKVTATDFVKPSDINLKENVTLLANMLPTSCATLDNLMEMNVITYNYKDDNLVDPDGTKVKLIKDGNSYKEVLVTNKENLQNDCSAKQLHYGLSAQELLKIYPDVVRKGQDGYWGIDYTELVPILIRSIQELKHEVDKLKSK